MPEPKKALKILDELENKELTLKEIKEKTGSGTGINNIRKALHKLLIEDLIEPYGYDKTSESFKFDNLKFRLVEKGKNRWNPIYIKYMLDNPQENYREIREIFSDTVKKINKIYEDENISFKECIDKMPLIKALDEGFIKPERVFKHDVSFVNGEKKETPITVIDYSKKHPNAMIWYFKKNFTTKFALIEKRKLPFFPPTPIIDEDDSKTKENVLKKVYQSRFISLPLINEEYVFRKLVIGAIKDKGEKGDERRWELAHKLVLDSDSLIWLIEELDFIFDTAADEIYEMPRFFRERMINIANDYNIS